jgi:hypothetical protein
MPVTPANGSPDSSAACSANGAPHTYAESLLLGTPSIAALRLVQRDLGDGRANGKFHGGLTQIRDRPRHERDRSESHTKDWNAAARPWQEDGTDPYSTSLHCGRTVDSKHTEWHRVVTVTDYRRPSPECARANDLTRILCVTGKRHFPRWTHAARYALFSRATLQAPVGSESETVTSSVSPPWSVRRADHRLRRENNQPGRAAAGSGPAGAGSAGPRARPDSRFAAAA